MILKLKIYILKLYILNLIKKDTLNLKFGCTTFLTTLLVFLCRFKCRWQVYLREKFIILIPIFTLAWQVPY